MSGGSRPIRVALVDDHSMVREALAAVLAEDGGIEVVAQGESGGDAVRIARELAPDVLVLDYNLPGGGAPSALDEISRASPDTRVLVLTVHDSAHYAVRVLEGGAEGFLVKSSAVEELLDAIRAVHRGEIYITPAISPRVIDQLRRPRRTRTGIESLSARELEVLRLLAEGRGLKEVAFQLSISVSTASTYRARVMEKLGLASTSELIRFALENGLVG